MGETVSESGAPWLVRQLVALEVSSKFVIADLLPATFDCVVAVATLVDPTLSDRLIGEVDPMVMSVLFDGLADRCAGVEFAYRDGNANGPTPNESRKLQIPNRPTLRVAALPVDEFLSASVRWSEWPEWFGVHDEFLAYLDLDATSVLVACNESVANRLFDAFGDNCAHVSRSCSLGPFLFIFGAEAREIRRKTPWARQPGSGTRRQGQKLR